MKLGLLVLLVASIPAGVSAKGRDDRKDDAVRITVLQTSDLHHHANGSDHVGLDVDALTGRGAIGSYARIAAYVNHVRASAGNQVLLVDSGDWTMGTLYDLTLGKEPLALRFLDLMRYDCVTLGNHEFDYSSKGSRRSSPPRKRPSASTPPSSPRTSCSTAMQTFCPSSARGS